MMLDGRCTINNENRGWYYAARSGYISVLAAILGNVLVMNASTLERYIPNATFYSYVDKYSFFREFLMAGWGGILIGST